MNRPLVCMAAVLGLLAGISQSTAAPANLAQGARMFGACSKSDQCLSIVAGRRFPVTQPPLQDWFHYGGSLNE